MARIERPLIPNSTPLVRCFRDPRFPSLTPEPLWQKQQKTGAKKYFYKYPMNFFQFTLNISTMHASGDKKPCLELILFDHSSEKDKYQIGITERASLSDKPL